MVEAYAYGGLLDEYVHVEGGASGEFVRFPNDFGYPAFLDAETGIPRLINMNPEGGPATFANLTGGSTNVLARSAYGNPWLFNGRAWDAELGLYHYRNRYMDPVQGRFTTRDPIGLWGDPMNVGNGYSYVGNNPWTYVDPFGLEGLNPLEVLWNYVTTPAGSPVSFSQIDRNRLLNVIDEDTQLNIYNRDLGVANNVNQALAEELAQRGVQIGVQAGLARTAEVGVALGVETAQELGFLGGAWRWCKNLFRGADNVAETGTRFANDSLELLWDLDPKERGVIVENYLAATDYADWFRVGKLDNGKFPLVDFQYGQNLVSVKTVQTNASGWLGQMKDHIEDLGTRNATVDDIPAAMILDLRVQPGGVAAAQSLVDYGKELGVLVQIQEFR